VIVSPGGNRVVLPTGRLKGHALLHLILEVTVDRLLLRPTGRGRIAGPTLNRGLLGSGGHHRAAVLTVVVLTLHLQINIRPTDSRTAQEHNRPTIEIEAKKLMKISFVWEGGRLERGSWVLLGKRGCF